MQDAGHCVFVSFVNKLIVQLGIERVFICYDKNTPSLSEETTDEKVTLRAWLAAEILCTWKWPGGSALASFLPLLSAYAKASSSSSKEKFLESIFNILLDGALVHGGCSGLRFVTPWAASKTEVENIEEPFLRALVSFLTALFEDNIWRTDKAMMLFELLADKLYIGEAINMNCLRILPRLISILVQPLFESTSVETGADGQHDSSERNAFQDIISGWLQKVLLFPPLILWETEQGN